MTRLLTLAEAAAYLRVSRRTLARLIAAGRIRVIHPSPGPAAYLAPACG